LAASKVDELIKTMNAALGGNVLQKGSDKRYAVEYMSTGLLPFDIALNGGIPRGRFVMFTGAYSTMKSYMGLCAIADAQRRGEVAALIDTEHAFDPDWAAVLGVDTTRLILWPPLTDTEAHTGEEALDAAEVLIRNNVNLIVFDSVAAALPQQEQGKRLSKESVQPGRLAALMSLAMRKLTAPNQMTGVLWINQLREQIGVTFGNPEKATGGRALGYYSSMILNARQAGFITETAKVYDGDQNRTTKRKVGQTFALQLQKSKLSTPWTDLFFDYSMVHGGVDMPKFLFAQGVELGIIQKQGNGWVYDGKRYAGKEKILTAITTVQEVAVLLEDEIRAAHGLPRLGPLGLDSKKASGSSGKSSSGVGQKRTLVRAAGTSRSTGPLRRKSSK
jgi:recombination protein RecA